MNSSHALQTFSDSYKRIDPIFSKRCRQLQRALSHCCVAAAKSASAGTPTPDMYSSLREMLSAHSAFANAFASRAEQLFFPNAEQLLEDLGQLKEIDENAKKALLSNDKEAMAKVVQELLQL